MLYNKKYSLTIGFMKNFGPTKFKILAIRPMSDKSIKYFDSTAFSDSVKQAPIQNLDTVSDSASS